MAETRYDYRGRHRRLAQALEGTADALLVMHMPNVRYLTGFTGSSGVLAVAGGARALFTDGRYTQQAKEEVEGARVVNAQKGSTVEAGLEWLRAHKVRTLAIEAERTTVAAHGALRKAAKGLRLKATTGLVERLRMVKDAAEIAQLRAAVNLGSSLLETALNALRMPAVTESEIAAEIEYSARRRGAEGMAFDTIVASGVRSALPHGRASHARVPERGFVLFDYGVILGGYCSDMSRTVFVGEMKRAERRLYESVLEAQRAAVSAVRAGATAESVDAAARKVLEKARVAQYFTHSCGHGVGLEIHEPPRLGERQKQPLEAGMVVTVEPGAYVPGRGGVRIEDMVLVTERGCEMLTPTPKELVVL